MSQNCNHCRFPHHGAYCPRCGQPSQLERINAHLLIAELVAIFNFERGILFTIKELLLRPGHNIRVYINTNRRRLVKPIGFIILCSLTYIIAQRYIQFSDGYINFSDLDWGSHVINNIMVWIGSNYGFANLIMANFIAIFIRQFFRSYGHNIFEVLILIYYIMGVQMLLFTFLGVLEGIFNYPILDIGSSLGIIYVCWAIGQFYDGTKKLNYVKALFAYFIGMISFMLFVLMAGKMIELLL